MRAVHVLAALGLAITVAVGLIMFPFAAGEVAPESDGTESGVSQDSIEILAGVDLDAGPIVLILHALATGDEMLAVTDAAALRAAQELGVSYTDPVTGPDAAGPYASVLQNGRVIRELTCRSQRCEGTLGPLPDAARPVRAVDDYFATAADARLELTEIRADPDRFMLEEPDLPPEGAPEPPGTATLYLPLRIRIVSGPEKAEDWDQDAEAAILLNLIRGALAKADAKVALGDLLFDQASGPIPLVDAATGAPVEGPNGPPRIDGFAFASPSVILTGEEAEFDRLRDLGTFEALALPPDASSEFDGAFAKLVKGALGSDCTSCYVPRTLLAVVNAPELGPYEPQGYLLSWYEIGDRPSP